MINTRFMTKVLRLEDLIKIRTLLKKQGRKVVFTNGCFDLLHGGHVYLLREARKLGDVLIVAVNDDASIKKFKGPHRPIFPLAERLEVLESISAIDYLISFSEETPEKLITAILPDALVKGGDWKPDEVVGKDEVEKAGGEVIVIPYLPGYSSSRIVDEIVQAVRRSTSL